MLTLKKFCFCFKLETGGYFVGWSGIISSLFLCIAMIATIIFTLPDVVDYVNHRFAVRDKSNLPIMSKKTFKAVI